MPHALSPDGMRIHFEAAESGVPVLLLHPNNATSRSWLELGWFDALAELGLRAVALDARGFGESDDVTVASQLAPWTSTDDIAAVLAALEIESAHLCGFSLGAAAALRCAIDRPESVSSLVLGGLGLGPLVQMGLFSGNDAEQARSEALSQLERVRPASERAAGYFGLLGATIAATELSPLGAAAGAVRAPVLGVAGSLDRFAPVRLFEQMRASGVAIEIRELPGVGHGACFIDPAFRAAALDFLRRRITAR
jgi:pimeloyl-ACP methyl ester carboxylesterase